MIKIEFSGTGEEVRNEMLKLLGLETQKDQTKSSTKEKIEQPVSTTPTPVKTRRARTSKKSPQPTWTKDEAQILWAEIKPNAQKILTEMAAKPEGYKRSELLDALGLAEHAMRGQLSSVGAALRRMGNKPSPIMKEKIDGKFTYKLDPAVVEVARR